MVWSWKYIFWTIFNIFFAFGVLYLLLSSLFIKINGEDSSIDAFSDKHKLMFIEENKSSILGFKRGKFLSIEINGKNYIVTSIDPSISLLPLNKNLQVIQFNNFDSLTNNSIVRIIEVDSNDFSNQINVGALISFVNEDNSIIKGEVVYLEELDYLKLEKYFQKENPRKNSVTLLFISLRQEEVKYLIVSIKMLE